MHSPLRSTDLWSGLLNLFFPSFCPSCGNLSDRHRTAPVCLSCWDGIRRLEGKGCRICASVTSFDPGSRCQECRLIKPVFERVMALGVYEGALKEVIHAMKFRKVKRLSRFLGSELAGLALPPADCIAPVPLSARGLRRHRLWFYRADVGFHVPYGDVLVCKISDEECPCKGDYRGQNRNRISLT